jgi:hypothetical protein
MQTIRLLTCDNIQEANLIKGRLENEGIPAIVTNENFTTLMPFYNGMLGAGVQVLVHEHDYQRASELLVLNTIDDSAIKCPNCSSSNIKFGLGVKKRNKIFMVLLSLLFFVPFGNIKSTYFCLDCRTEFA